MIPTADDYLFFGGIDGYYPEDGIFGYIYNINDGKMTATPYDGNYEFFGVSGDYAYFEYYDDTFAAFNMITNTGTAKQLGVNHFDYMGTYSGKAYFYNSETVVCFDVAAGSVTKIKFPEGYNSEDCFFDIKITKIRGRMFLKFEYRNNDSHNITRYREIN